MSNTAQDSSGSSISEFEIVLFFFLWRIVHVLCIPNNSTSLLIRCDVLIVSIHFVVEALKLKHGTSTSTVAMNDPIYYYVSTSIVLYYVVKVSHAYIKWWCSPLWSLPGPRDGSWLTGKFSWDKRKGDEARRDIR